jgi:hypothetical protein
VKKRYVTVLGKTRSLDDWALRCGLSKAAISARLARGLTPEQAVGLEQTPKERREEARARRTKTCRPTYTVDGFTGAISAIAEHFNVPQARLYSRHRMGWPEKDWLLPTGSPQAAAFKRLHNDPQNGCAETTREAPDHG